MRNDPKLHIPAQLLSYARDMRKNPAPAEQKLWHCLRDRQLNGYKFRRQQPLPPFIADFFCADAKLVVELDGDSHDSRETYDRARTVRLNHKGLRVIRFLNPDIHDHLDAVLEEILLECEAASVSTPTPTPYPSPQPSPSRGEGVRIAILGFAHGHVDVYCNAWREKFSDHIKLIAGWDHDATRAAKARDQHKIESAPTVDSILSRKDIDAVIIGAETSLHAELVEQAARASKTIILQKPLALTLDQADRIVAAVAESHVPFTLAWQMRVDPHNLQMRDMIESGKLGRIFMVRRRHGLSTHTWTGFENTWHVKPELNRGMWADDAAHAIDWLLWTLGKPESVMSQIETLHSQKVPDDNGIAIFRYPNGTLAEITCSFTCLASENTVEIVGENGVIIQNFGDAPSCNAPRPPGAIGLKWLMRGDKQWTLSDIPSPPNHADRIAALAPELLKFLQGERPPICTAEEGRTSLAMTLACYDSSSQGQRIRID